MYLLLPVDGAPRVIDAKPTDSRISDGLGGTYVRAAISRNTAAVHMRDDAAGLPFNPAATYLLSMIGDTDDPFPAYGNVIVTGMDTIACIDVDAGPVAALGSLTDLTADRAQAGADIATDGFYAWNGHDKAMRFPRMADKVRYVLGQAMKIKIPDGWPGCMDRQAQAELSTLEDDVYDLIDQVSGRRSARRTADEATNLDGPFCV